MKIILIIFLLVMFIILAIFVYLKYYCRYVIYKDLIYICKVFKGDIYFKKNIVKDIFNSLTDNLSIFTKQIIKSKTDSHLLLNKKDIENVRMFVGSIGAGDVDFEINNINYYESNFLELKESSYNQLNKDGKMYLKLIIGLGIGICIILL